MDRSKLVYMITGFTGVFYTLIGSLANADQKLITHEEKDRIPNHYIVVLRTGLSSANVESIIDRTSLAANIKFKYHHVFKGFSGEFTQDALKKLESDPEIEFIEEDAKVTANASSPVNVDLSPSFSTTSVQDNPPWGLDRIDQPDLPLDQSYYYSEKGWGVNAYVVDTGIRSTHADFERRAFPAFTSISDGVGTSDCHGHGTHVAATIGGKKYGVAKKVNLFAVRVLNCGGSGTLAGVIAGLDWIHANHKKPAVINMSLGSGGSTALDAAVESNIQAGITTVVAAGNSNASACLFSPARVPRAITTGASTIEDARAGFSNYGGCVSLFAPGVDIKSAWNGSDNDSKSISGTSMASPHAAGVAALYLAHYKKASPEEVKQELVEAAVFNRIKNANGSPNLLLQSSVGH